MNDNVIEIALRANTANLVAGLKEAGTATGTTGAQMRSELAGIGAGAKEAHAPMSGFTSILKEYRQEMRTEGRYARFMAADIASMGIASKGAAGEVTQLIAAFALGNTMGLAIEGVKMLIKHFTELRDETEKVERLTKLYGDDLKKMGEEGAKHVAGVKKQVVDTLLAMRELRAETLLRHQLEEPLKKEKDLKEQIAKLTEQIAQGSASSAVTEAGIVMQDVSLLERRKAKLEEELRKVKAEMAGLRKDVAPLQVVDERAVAVAEEVEEAKRAAARETEEHAINLLRIQTEQERSTAKETAEFKKELAKEVAEAERRALEATEESQRTLLRIETQQDIQARKAAAELALRTAGVKKGVAELGHAFSESFKGIIRGTMDVGEAMKNLGLGIVDSIIDALVKVAEQELIAALTSKTIDSVKAVAEVTHNAAIAGSAVAAATAPFALFGAVGIGEAMAAAVEGAFLPMASAAVGMPYVPADMPVMVHRKEAILTSSEADDWRNGRGGGSGGGVSVTINASALDQRWWDQHKREIVRTIRDAAREGRL